jgi:hypothetical protein
MAVVKLTDALANRLYVAGMTRRLAARQTGDCRRGQSVPLAGEPLGRRPGLADFDQ